MEIDIKLTLSLYKFNILLYYSIILLIPKTLKKTILKYYYIYIVNLLTLFIKKTILGFADFIN